MNKYNYIFTTRTKKELFKSFKLKASSTCTYSVIPAGETFSFKLPSVIFLNLQFQVTN